MSVEKLKQTIPPAKLKDFAHLPLHKGGLVQRKVKQYVLYPIIVYMDSLCLFDIFAFIYYTQYNEYGLSLILP